MDARLSAEQAELREAAARLADDLGPHSVLDLADAERQARLEKAVAATGWRSLRSDGASGVEIALVAEELARGAVDVPFLGRVLADALRPAGALWPAGEPATMAVAGRAVDARGASRALALDGARLLSAPVGEPQGSVDLTRVTASLSGPLEPAGEISAAHAARWQALAIVVTTAELVGAARGAHALAVGYSRVREQYGDKIGTFQAIAHLLAEGLALIEGSESILRYAAWAVDELRPAEALKAARIAKVYCAQAARTVCETAIQVHGGIGNTWECLAHVYLRRVLVNTELFAVRLEEIEVGLPGLSGGGGIPLPAPGVARGARGRVQAVRRRVLDPVRRVAPGAVRRRLLRAVVAG
jgi:alkylation response protein AidB-like acyl-CoA dehydrogenase